MAISNIGLRRPRSSGPVREPTLRPRRLPRRATLWQAVLVAVLLTLAAGVLYAREPTSACPAPENAASHTVPQAPADAADPKATSDPADGDPLALPSGLVGVPVRLAEPAVLAVVRPGARVDLLAVRAGGDQATPAEPTLIAAKVLVIDVLDADGLPALYLALQPDQAHKTIGLPESVRFSVIVR